MKRLLAMIISGLLALSLLSGCGDKAEQPSPSPEGSEPAVSAPVESPDPSEAPIAPDESDDAGLADNADTPPADDSGSAVGAMPLSELDLLISAGGALLTLDQSADEVFAALGEDYDYFEAISCAYDGMDKTYIYDGIEVYCYPQGQEDFVLELTIVTDRYQTARGLSVGASADEVLAAYGEDCLITDMMIEYDIDGSLLTFMLADDAVSAIDYYRG